MSNPSSSYVGHVEQDPKGDLWAVLYYGDQVVTREQASSLRKAKRRVSDLVLTAVDDYPMGPPPATTPCPRVGAKLPSQSTKRVAITHLV